MEIKCIWEHNGDDSLLYAQNCVGAFTRGESLAVVMAKMPEEIKSYMSWKGEAVPEEVSVIIVQEKESKLNIKDADSDVLFDEEECALTLDEYTRLKELALKSAKDFQL